VAVGTRANISAKKKLPAFSYNNGSGSRNQASTA
jgi:hypothetical protein